MTDYINQIEVSPIIFKHPFKCMISEPSKSGKTTLLKKILNDHIHLIKPVIEKIVYCYSRWQENFEILKFLSPKIEFHQGLPDIEEFNNKTNNLLILDDLMKESSKEKMYKISI